MEMQFRPSPKRKSTTKRGKSGEEEIKGEDAPHGKPKKSNNNNAGSGNTPNKSGDEKKKDNFEI
jgi:hypothetical protein